MKKSLGPKTLLYPTPVWVVGTYDKDEKPNVMTIAWGGICCSKPPCVTISLRKATYSYGNIVERKAFTINIPSEVHCREADYFGLVSGKNEDKFTASGLTSIKCHIVSCVSRSISSVCKMRVICKRPYLINPQLLPDIPNINTIMIVYGTCMSNL